MIRGLYASASSLLSLLHRQEALSHNLANINTPGFKQEVVVAQKGTTWGLVQDWGNARYSPTIGGFTYVVEPGETELDYRQGPLENTQRPLDIAIAGDGFFRVQTPDGVRLTRDGTFHRDSAGNIVTAEGYFLLGDNGPIRIGEGTPYVATDGSIYLPGQTTPAARIALARVGDVAALQTEGDNLLNPGNAPVEVIPPAQTVLKQGFVEQSNVDVAGTVVSMMLALRSYEATQRTMRLQDEALQRVLDVGR
ncbi:MAG: flagellar hook-basal body protein [Anaerolineae bacterium]|nr:flagellar hook-basal body protein [Anaerolineae bacterium]